MSQSVDFGKLLWESYEKQEGVDFFFSFINDDKEPKEMFGVHSVVLTLQSEVFKSMINGSLKSESPVLIKDTSPAIFRKFIR